MSTRVISRMGFIVLLLSVVFSGPARSVAQEGQAQPAVSSSSEKETSAKGASENKKEAAQGDDTEQFKQSASVRALAGKLGISAHNAYWLSVILNFLIIAGAIIYFSRLHLPTFFRNRTDGIRKAMDEAKQASEEARRRLSEIESRLAKLGDEITAMRASAEKEAAAEEERLRVSAEADKKKIVEAAEQEIASAAKNARRELTAYAADLAVTLAQKRIHVDAATDQSLVSSFTKTLGDGKAGN